MRTTTLTRALRVALILAGLAVLPQFASAQLPIETQTLRLQGSTSGSVNMNVPATGGTGYTITLPATLTAGTGAFMYTNNTTGGLSWTNTASDGAVLKFKTGVISWVDPTTDPDNKNWSIAGNTLAGPGTLGAKSDHGVDIITNNQKRIEIAAGGNVSINNATDIDGGLTINNTGLTVTAGGATITAGGLTVTAGGATVTAGGATINGGGLTLGTGNDLTLIADPGNSGDVLVSKGDNNTPEWQNLTESIGIRKAGNVPVSNATSTAAINVTDLAATDAILVTLQGSGSTVVATVTDRVNDAAGSFKVTFSGSYAGTVNYMVLKALNNTP